MIPFPHVSPEIFSITLFGFEFALRWYAMAYIVGILIGWRIAVTAINRATIWPNDTTIMTKEQVEDLLTWIILGVILGGRIGYVLFYGQGAFWSSPLDILKVWEGGMSFHGGFAGVIAAVYFFTRKHGLALWSTADMLALSVPPALFLGRVANFINAELWGRPTDLPWAVPFPGADAQSCGAFIGICTRHPSQLYEAILEGLILGAVLLWLAFRSGGLKHKGMLTGLFFAGYGIARFAVEFVRQPDAQFASEGNPLGLALQLGEYGFTMGQLLSLPMVAIGLWLIVRSKRP